MAPNSRPKKETRYLKNNNLAYIHLRTPIGIRSSVYTNWCTFLLRKRNWPPFLYLRELAYFLMHTRNGIRSSVYANWNTYKRTLLAYILQWTRIGIIRSPAYVSKSAFVLMRTRIGIRMFFRVHELPFRCQRSRGSVCA